MNEGDIANLAELHLSALNDSLVGAMGEDYVRAFYRYVTSSDQELFFLERNESGRIVAAAVISLEPATLSRRLLLKTPLLRSMLGRIPGVIALLLAKARRSRREPHGGHVYVPIGPPELIDIYTAPEAQGKGLGSAIVRQIDQRLRDLHLPEYVVLAVAESSNPACRFYRGRGFTSRGLTLRLGTYFEVFARSLRDPHST